MPPYLMIAFINLNYCHLSFILINQFIFMSIIAAHLHHISLHLLFAYPFHLNSYLLWLISPLLALRSIMWYLKVRISLHKKSIYKFHLNHQLNINSSYLFIKICVLDIWSDLKKLMYSLMDILSWNNHKP